MKNYKVWLLLGLVFLAGMAAGTFATRAVVRRVVQAALIHPERAQYRIERDLQRKLRLNASQAAEVAQILAASREELQGLRRDVQPRIRGIFQNARQRISKVLTAEQQARFEKYLADHPLPGMAATLRPTDAPDITPAGSRQN